MAMQVREWMSPDPVTVEPVTDLREARLLLQQYGVRHLPVTRAGRLVGIVSDRDVRLDQSALDAIDEDDLLAFVRGARSVSDVMSRSIHVTTPDAPVAAAARLMLSRRISALPVVDDDRTLTGIITSTDCLLALMSLEAAAAGAGEQASSTSWSADSERV